MGAPGRRGLRRLGLGLGVLLAVVAAAWVLGYLLAGDKVPRGTTVAGIAIGGLSEEEAVARLEDELGGRAERAIEVEVGGSRSEVRPADTGFALDYAASVDEAGARKSWSPAWLWAYATGGGEVDPVVAIDDAALTSYLDDLDEEVRTDPVDGAISFRPKGVDVTEPVIGSALDTTAARDALVAAYVAADDATIELPVTEVAPDIDADDVRVATEEFATPAMSGPVTLRFGESEVVLKPRQYARALSLVPEGGRLVPQLASKRLAKQLAGLVSGDGAEPVDAEIKLLAGKPRVIPAKPGVSFDQAEVDAAFLELVARPEGERAMDIPAQVVEPAFTTEDAKALGIKKQVSVFTTYFPYAEYRNINIGRAAELIDGTIVRPGRCWCCGSPRRGSTS